MKAKSYSSVKRCFLPGVILCLIAGLVAAGKPVDNEAVALERITRVLPEGWSIVATKADSLPEGHYWGLEYAGPKGLEIILQGKRDVLFQWKDKHGVWHEEPLAREALRLWLMPPSYKESWLRFFVLHRPKAAASLLGGQRKIYSYPSHQIVAVERFQSIVGAAASTRWLDSPADTELLSWKNWAPDLRRAFEGDS